MTVLDRFLAFLKMSDRSLQICVDLYNKGQLSPLSALALEAIEAMYDDDYTKRKPHDIP